MKEDNASFRKEAVLCAVIAAAAVSAGLVVLYKIRNAKSKTDPPAQHEEESGDSGLAPLTVDQIPWAFEANEHFQSELDHLSAANVLERLANCLEENGELMEALGFRQAAFVCYSRGGDLQKVYELMVRCIQPTLQDHDTLLIVEGMCASACILIHSPKALEHFDHCEEYCLSSTHPQANLAQVKSERGSQLLVSG
jgi:hypothetical protein